MIGVPAVFGSRSRISRLTAPYTYLVYTIYSVWSSSILGPLETDSQLAAIQATYNDRVRHLNGVHKCHIYAHQFDTRRSGWAGLMAVISPGFEPGSSTIPFLEGLWRLHGIIPTIVHSIFVHPDPNAPESIVNIFFIERFEARANEALSEIRTRVESAGGIFSERNLFGVQSLPTIGNVMLSISGSVTRTSFDNINVQPLRAS